MTKVAPDAVRGAHKSMQTKLYQTARKGKWWEGATERQGVQGDDVVERELMACCEASARRCQVTHRLNVLCPNKHVVARDMFTGLPYPAGILEYK